MSEIRQVQMGEIYKIPDQSLYSYHRTADYHDGTWYDNKLECLHAAYAWWKFEAHSYKRDCAGKRFAATRQLALALQLQELGVHVG